MQLQIQIEFVFLKRAASENLAGVVGYCFHQSALLSPSFTAMKTMLFWLALGISATFSRSAAKESDSLTTRPLVSELKKRHRRSGASDGFLLKKDFRPRMRLRKATMSAKSMKLFLVGRAATQDTEELSFSRSSGRQEAVLIHWIYTRSKRDLQVSLEWTV